MYQKEIIYMGLHKDGSRIGSAGFLKAEKRDKTSALTMIVKNIPHTIEGKFPVRYRLGTDSVDQSDRADWKEEDGITLRDGGGVWEKKELEAPGQIHVQILLPNGYLVEGASKAVEKQTSPKDEMPAELVPVRQDESVEPVPMQKSASAAEPYYAAAAGEPEPVSVLKSVSVEPAPVRRDEPAESESVPLIVPLRPPLMADALAIEGLKEDKWEQILDSYDQIHPYGDDRVYVKIAPKDFIILSGNCQHLVNNSFLLHGFYNYRYVILGRRENSFRELSLGEQSVSLPEGDYCLGVPGVYYEREKMVALMFGFEAFECEGGDPKPGDFGYYLRKVEL